MVLEKMIPKVLKKFLKQENPWKSTFVAPIFPGHKSVFFHFFPAISVNFVKDFFLTISVGIFKAVIPGHF